MTTGKTSVLGRWLMLVVWACLGLAAVQAADQPLNLEVKLIWGTNDAESPDPAHKKLDSSLTKWLGKTYQWRNYFEVNMQSVVLPLNTLKRIRLSKDCELALKNLGSSKLEVEVFGRGQNVGKVVHKLPEKDRLVIAGEDKNDTAWFIAFKILPGK